MSAAAPAGNGWRHRNRPNGAASGRGALALGSRPPAQPDPALVDIGAELAEHRRQKGQGGSQHRDDRQHDPKAIDRNAGLGTMRMAASEARRSAR